MPGRRGRPRIWPARRIIEAILYLDRAGCAWRSLPADFPPWQTVYGYFAAWRDDGTLTRLHDALRAQVRTAAGRSAEPTAAVIDSQSVRAADTVPKAARGWDNAKKINGRKRHIAVDTTGLVLAIVITAASVQDRDGARPLLWNLHRACRTVRLVWADAGYATSKLTAWAATMKMTIQVVAKRNQHVFEVLPRRWVVERTFAWISKHRRTVRDYEHLPASHEAMILWAMIALMTRRLTQTDELPDTHLVWGTGRHAAGGVPMSGEGWMRISDVLRVKGAQVVTVTPDTTVRRLLAVLAEHGIGAVVVSGDGASVDGIASERDIVRALALRGAAVMSAPVTAICTADVHTVTPGTPLEEVARMMTERRVRHAPVVADGALRGIVSIGDVVKSRIDELETERAALTDYITGTR
jgi:putative transposase